MLPNLLWYGGLCKGQALLDLCYRQCGIQTLGTYSRAIENSVATVQAHAVVQGLLPLLSAFVSAVG
jgi:hypothetical protein